MHILYISLIIFGAPRTLKLSDIVQSCCFLSFSSWIKAAGCPVRRKKGRRWVWTEWTYFWKFWKSPNLMETLRLAGQHQQKQQFRGGWCSCATFTWATNTVIVYVHHGIPGGVHWLLLPIEPSPLCYKLSPNAKRCLFVQLSILRWFFPALHHQWFVVWRGLSTKHGNRYEDEVMWPNTICKTWWKLKDINIINEQQPEGRGTCPFRHLIIHHNRHIC